MINALTDSERASVGSLQNYGPTISIFGASARDAVRTAEALRANIIGPSSIDGAAMNDRWLGDASLVELTEDGGRQLDDFLDRLNAHAAIERLPVVVNANLDTIDIAAARLDAPSIALICDATQAERCAALSLMIAVRDRVQSDGAEAIRLQRLADEVGRIARTLTELAGDERQTGDRMLADGWIGFRAEPMRVANGGPGASELRATIRLRRLRDRFFPAALFADPAWDMLLDLMAARLERRRVAVSSLCIAAAVPPTTALRWIKTMTEEGLFVRVGDPTDARRIFIELSEGAAKAMQGFFAAAKGQDGLAV